MPPCSATNWLNRPIRWLAIRPRRFGVVGNADHSKQSLGKAGRNRWLGKRPHVRGVAMNPVDHPNGGGQGKSKGGGGRQQLVSPWGQLAKGFPTRRRRKLSTSMIILHHNGRKPRRQK